LLALAALAIAGCGSSSSLRRTGPVWTPVPDASAIPGTPMVAGDWPTFDADAVRSGVNPGETAISAATVGGLRRQWRTALPQPADSTPILLHDLRLPDGAQHDVLYVTTQGGTTLALDAATGAILWRAAPVGQRITNSSPVADPANHVIYSYGLDGKVHRYDAATGAETRDAVWPVTVTRMPGSEKQGSALTLANGYLYVTTGGYIGDAPPYQGHVVAIHLIDGRVTVFNSLCSNIGHVLGPGECPDDQSGLWARAGVVVDPITGYLFVASGNGPYTANQGGHDWGDSVIELSADASHIIDSFTPAGFAALDQFDQDLGSTMPALLPPIAGSQTPYLLVQGGKDDVLRLLDRQNLSRQGGPGHVAGELQIIATPGKCNVLTQPAVWQDPASHAIWVYVTDDCGTGAYRVVTSAQGVTTLAHAWDSPQGGTSPVLAGGVLFVAASGAVRALDPHSGRQLWSSADAGTGGSIGNVHWQSPIVIGGRLYCSDQDGNLTAYGS
jgi:outer membrane protein assembly factor BamB